MFEFAPALESYTSEDGTRFLARSWDVASPQGEVIFLHGIISHSGWYEASCASLAAQGFRVHFLDRRGSGLQRCGAADVESWQVWLRDVMSFVATLPAERPRLLLGISWGGILATSLAKRYGDHFTGLGLICPGLCSRRASSGVQKAAILLGNALGLANRAVSIPLQEPHWFTNTPRHQRYIADDPLTLRKITLRFAKENLQLWDDARAEPEKVSLPTLLMLAGKDPIIDNPATRALVDRFARPAKVIEYAGASHTLEFEEDPKPYFADLAAWCRETVAGSTASLLPHG